jgi:hypothetical protein
VAGLVTREPGLTLEDANRRAWMAAGQLARDGQADDPSADDSQIAARQRLGRLDGRERSEARRR